MSNWIDTELKSIGSPAIVEYIGPYGAGKTTRLSGDKRELQKHHARVSDREDFKDFIAGYTKAQKAFLLLFNVPLYSLAFVLLWVQSRGATISDRLRRCHLVAMKSIYFRRFMKRDKKIFLSDEGLLHSCCQLFTGVPRVPNALLLKLLYWRLNPVFVRIEVEEMLNVKFLSRRVQIPVASDPPVDSDLRSKKFIDLMKSGEASDVHVLVRESRGFYHSVTPVVNRIWHTVHTYTVDESA